jgi:hypothetical protein
MELIIPAGVPSLASRYDVQVTDYASPRIEGFFLDSDTGLFANDLVTSAAYQSNTTNGAITGSFSPALDTPDKFVAISNNFDGATVYDANGSPKNTLSALDDGSTGLNSDPALGQWLADQSGVEVVYTVDGTTLSNGEAYTFTFTTSNGPLTLSYTAPSDNATLMELIDFIFQNQGWADAGYRITSRDPGYSVERTDGEDFTITLSQNLIDLGKVSTREFGPSGQQDTLITDVIRVENGATDHTGAFLTKVKQGTLATPIQNGNSDTQTAEVQTVDFLVVASGSMRTFFGDLRFGSVIVELAVGFQDTDSTDVVAAEIQRDIDRVFGNSNPGRPTVSVGSFGTPDGNDELLVDLTFTWNHNNYANVDYLVLVDDDRATTLVEQTFDITLDQTAASTPVLADSDGANDGKLTVAAGTNINTNITGLTAGEYLYVVWDGNSQSNEATDFWTYIANGDDATALATLRSLDSTDWSRSQVDADGKVSIDTSGLLDGGYKLVAMDLAGNFSQVAANTLEITDGETAPNHATLDATIAGINADADADMELVFSVLGSAQATAGDSTAKAVFDLVDVAVGDTVELYADGLLVYSIELTAAQVAAGTLETSEIDFATADDRSSGDGNTGTSGDDKVALELKLKHGDTYIQENGVVTWEYQW